MRFTKMCAVRVPDRLASRLEKADEEDAVKIGVEFTVEQCRNLLAQGVSNLHFYTLNRYPNIKTILAAL
jgi:methylenetetrahydrofolate reductase (NADPH)